MKAIKWILWGFAKAIFYVSMSPILALKFIAKGISFALDEFKR